MRRLALVATVLSSLWAADALATEYLAGGTKLVIKDTGVAKKLVYLSKDPSIDVPAPGGADDPSVAGATFTINASNPNGIETAQFTLPSDGWSSQQGGQGTRFRFVNPTAPAGSSLVRSVVLRPGLLKLKAEAAGITLDEASQIGIGVRLDAGASSWCSDFGANITRNEPGLFKAKAQGQAPGACTPQMPPVCGNGTIEPGEQCDGEEFCNATCLIEATGCCQYGTAPGPFCSADIGIGATPSAIYVGCTQLNGTYLLGSVPSGTSLCAEAPEVTWMSGGPCQPLGPVAPTTLCCNAPDCIDAAVDDNAAVSSFVRNCMYTVIQDPAPVVVGTCGPSGFCVPAH